MSETRKLAAILVSDVAGYSRLAGADEDRTLARLRTLRSDLIDPTIAVHHGRVVKRTGDGSIVEFRSVVDAVNCAIEIQRAMVERNAGVAPDKRIVFRSGAAARRGSQARLGRPRWALTAKSARCQHLDRPARILADGRPARPAPDHRPARNRALLGSPAQALRAVCDLDLSELESVEPPRGFGRD
jgi:hypothetical protein